MFLLFHHILGVWLTFVCSYLILLLLLLSLFLLVLFQELVQFLFLFQVHLLHSATDVVPIRTHSLVNEGRQVFLPHFVTLFSQKLQQVNDVVGACLLEDQPLDLLLFLGEFALGLEHHLLVSFGFDLFQLLAESLLLLIQELYDLWLHESLMSLFGSRLSH